MQHADTADQPTDRPYQAPADWRTVRIAPFAPAAEFEPTGIVHLTTGQREDIARIYAGLYVGALAIAVQLKEPASAAAQHGFAVERLDIMRAMVGPETARALLDTALQDEARRFSRATSGASGDAPAAPPAPPPTPQA